MIGRRLCSLKPLLKGWRRDDLFDINGGFILKNSRRVARRIAYDLAARYVLHVFVNASQPHRKAVGK